MLEGQYQIYKDLKKILKQDLHNRKTRELITLAYVLILGPKHLIALYVERAFFAGATKRDILNVFYCIIGDEHLSSSILELLRILNLHHEKEKYK